MYTISYKVRFVIPWFSLFIACAPDEEARIACESFLDTHISYVNYITQVNYSDEDIAIGDDGVASEVPEEFAQERCYVYYVEYGEDAQPALCGFYEETGRVIEVTDISDDTLRDYDNGRDVIEVTQTYSEEMTHVCAFMGDA